MALLSMEHDGGGYVTNASMTTNDWASIVFPDNCKVTSASVKINSSNMPLMVVPGTSTQDASYLYVDISVSGYPNKYLTPNTTYNVTYRYIK